MDGEGDGDMDGDGETTPDETTGGPVKMAEPTVEARDGTLTVSWTEPASERSITHYEVRYKTASATEWEPEKPMYVTAMMTEITGLTNGAV